MSTATARKLFGTDGIRGIAGEAPLDARTIYATGLALGHSLRKTIAEPTRASRPRHARIEPVDRGDDCRRPARNGRARGERRRDYRLPPSRFWRARTDSMQAW